jgi:ABC-type multidrug transport system fused ATPase/permease subunit
MGVCGGAVAPLMSIVFGELIDIFDPRKTDAEISKAYGQLAIWIGIISGVLWISGYFQYAFLQHMAEKLSFDLRSRYLRALLKQETEFFERQ